MSEWPAMKARRVLAALLRIGWTISLRAGERPRLVTDLQLAPRSIGSKEREEFLREARSRAHSLAQQKAVQALEDVPFPKRMPIFDRILVSRDRRVWLREYTLVEGSAAYWHLVDTRTLATCRIPLPPRSSPLYADSAHVLMLVKSADDEEFVQLHRMR